MLEKIIRNGIIASVLLFGSNGCLDARQIEQPNVREEISQEYDAPREESDSGNVRFEEIEEVEETCFTATQGNTIGFGTTVAEGEPTTSENESYHVDLIYVDSESARFSVNGERTPKMNIGSSFKLANGKAIKLTDTLHETHDEGTHEADFCLLEQVEEPEIFEKDCEINSQIKDYFEKNESKSYLIDNLVYNIGIQEVKTDEDITKIKISINGEEGYLINNEPTSISGLYLTVLDIFDQGNYEGAVKGADICFQKDFINASIEVTISDEYKCGHFKDFPEEFHVDGVFKGYIVVGENSETLDNLAAIDISSSMEYVNQDDELVPVEFIDATKLDSEIADVSATNLISIGNPCVNDVTAELLGNPIDCSQGFYSGEAKIISLKHKETGNLALIVAGNNGEGTRLASRVIARRLETLQEIGGCIITVEGITYNGANIK